MLINAWMGAGLLSLWLIRVWLVRLKGLFISNLVLLMVPALVFVNYQHQQNQHKKLLSQQAAQQTIKLLINPDEVQFQQGKLHGEAYVPKLNQHVVLFGYLKDQSQLRKMANLTGPCNLKVTGTLTPIESAPNQNQFDAQRFFADKQIYGQFKVNQIETIHKLPITNAITGLHVIRYRGLKATATLPKTLRLYAQSLLFGLKNSDFKDEMGGVKQLGIIHLFSISGMHVYFLMDFILIFLFLLHMRKNVIDWGLIILLPGYFVIAGAAVGLLRAILMIEERLVSNKLGWYFSRLDIWSLALLLNLLINPTLLTQFGCQLSYVMSLGLIYCRNCKNWQRCILLNLISLPLILFYLYQWHALSLLANFLIIPFFSAVIFPAVIIGTFGSWLKLPGVNLIDNGLEIFDHTLAWLGELPGNIVFGKPLIIVVVILVLLSLLLIERVTKAKTILLVAFYLLLFLVIHFPVTGQVSFFDVGQGDSALVRMPFNRSVSLIDTGGKPNIFAKEGQKTVYLAPNTYLMYLKSIGIHHLDNICLSHQDADHVGDLPAVLKAMQVDRVYVPLGMKHNQHFMKNFRPFAKQTKLIEVKAGDQIAGSPLQVLHPFATGRGENKDSMVLAMTAGQLRWLFMGDLPQAQEQEIIKKMPNLRADVIKLGHHGSKTSSSPNFLKRLEVQVGIISAGRQNMYGHPNLETLQTLKRLHLKIFSTQKNGMITYKFTGNHVGIFKTKWREDHDVNSK